MEALKNILNPGKKHDDEILYGSGQSNDPVVAGTEAPQTQRGEGSQLESSAWNDPKFSPADASSNPDPTTGQGHHLGTGAPSGSGGVDDKYPSSGLRAASDDASTTASIKSGVPGRDQSAPLTASTGPSDSLNTNKPLPQEPTGTGYTGPSAGSDNGPHSSTLLNKMDPRVDSDHDGSRGVDHRGTGSGIGANTLPDRTVGSSGYGNDPRQTDSTSGRDAAVGAGAGAGLGGKIAAALHHKRDHDDLASDSGRSFPLAGHSDKSDHGAGQSGITGGTTAGPHSSNLANKADPRVDSDLDGSRTAGNSGFGSGSGPISGTVHHGDQTGSVASGGQPPVFDHGPESWRHEHPHDFAGDPCQHHAVKGDPIFTKGPHVTDTANLLDPHVTPSMKIPPASTVPDSGLGSTTQSGDPYAPGVSGLGSTPHGGDLSGLASNTQGGDRHGHDAAEPLSTRDGDDRHGDDHHGRGSALAGGLGTAGAAGAGAYASGRDNTSTEQPSTTTGPHHSKLLNKLDPRVHSGSSSDKPATTAETSAMIGSSRPGSSSHMPGSETVGTSHDHGRDAGSAGVGGITGYEKEKHLGAAEPSGLGTSTGGITSRDTAAIDTEPRHGQDPRSVGSAGMGTSESDPHGQNEKEHGLKAHLPGFLGGHHDKSKDTAGSGHHESTGTEPETGSGRHYGRDAGIASAGIGGGLAAYETQKLHNRDQPITTTDASTHAPSGYRDTDPTGNVHVGPDPTLAGGAGAGPVATGGSEFSKQEAEKLAEARQEEFEKEQEAIHKEHVKREKALEKEEKKHEKEEKKIEKEIKKHEKEEKKHEKEIKKHEKEEKKHEKELAKEEKKHDGKKHGGILGLFHHDKTDTEHENDELDQTRGTPYQGTEGDESVGAGVDHDTHKHEPNKLHKDPPAGYYESKGYEPPKTGDDSYGAAAGQGTVPEPHTGLPVDLSKGTGQGGTDGGPIPAYHTHDGDASGINRSRA